MRNAIYAMAGMASGGLLMFAITVLMAIKLSQTEQGVFFTFLSFGALVQLADFGISYAAMQTASHFTGSTRRNELPGLAARVLSWSFPTSCLAALIVGAIGSFLFYSTIDSEPASIHWRWPWLLFLACTCMSQIAAPSIALREGAGRILDVWRLRLFQEWCAGIACLLALKFDAGLWSLSLLPGTRGAISGVWLLTRGRLETQASTICYSAKRWRSEVWPFQWRIGLSALSGFLIFRLFSPLILMEHGPILAGQFGVAIAMMNLLLAVTSAWPMSQAARYGTLIAGGDFRKICDEFPKMLATSTAMSVALATSLSAAFYLLSAIGSGFSDRITDCGTTTIVLFTAVMHHVVACFAIPLRAERREPLLVVSLAGGILNAIGIWLAAHFGAARDIAWANFLFAAAGVPYVYYLYRVRSSYWKKA